MSEIRKALKAVLQNFLKSTITDSVEQNAGFQYDSGLSPKIVRSSPDGCCKWCQSRIGVWDYPCDSTIYQRHNNCNCTVVYDPGDGKVQDVYSKQWIEADEETLKERKKAGLETTSAEELEKRKTAGLEESKITTPGVEDVTDEYIRNATPGEGEITHDAGADEKDIATSEFLFEKFGGDIRTLEVEKVDGRDLKTPDALWNGIYWEYKNASTIKSIDNRVRRATIQLDEILVRKGVTDSKVGIALDISNKKQSIDDTISAAERVLLSRAKNNTDLLIKDGVKIVKAIRVQK